MAESNIRWNSDAESTEKTKEELEKTAQEGEKTAQSVLDKIQSSEYTEKMKEKAFEYGEKGREQAAVRIEMMAERVRERLGESDGLPAQAGYKLVEEMEDTARYLHQHNTDEMKSDFESFVRAHPAKALLGAIFFGLMLGKVLR